MVKARLDHVTAIVGDADKAAAAIERLLDLDPARPFALPGMNIRTLRVGDVELHLNAPTGDGPVRAFHERTGGGYHHIALAVDDLASALVKMGAAGFSTLGEPVTTAPGLREVFLDPVTTGGVLLQIVERRDTSADTELDGEAVASLASQAASQPEPRIR